MDGLSGLLNEHLWTGGTDFGDHRNFYWMGTGQPFNYTDWYAGEPNSQRYDLRGEGEDCVELYRQAGKEELGWNDCSCTDSNYFICETS